MPGSVPIASLQRRYCGALRARCPDADIGIVSIAEKACLFMIIMVILTLITMKKAIHRKCPRQPFVFSGAGAIFLSLFALAGGGCSYSKALPDEAAENNPAVTGVEENDQP